MSAKPTSPQTVAVMAVGATAAVGFAIWNVTRSMTPPPAVNSPTGLDPVAPAGKEAALIKSAPQSAPGSKLAAAPDALETEARNIPEAQLAPEADPFAPLPSHATKPNIVVKEAANSTASPALPTGTGAGRGPVLEAVKASMPNGAQNLLPPINRIPNGIPPTPPPALKEPDLAGTLLGDRPCAVFRAGDHLVTAPVGSLFQGWRVMAVQHGEVVLKGMGKTVRLSIGLNVASAPQTESVPAQRIGWNKTEEPKAAADAMPPTAPNDTKPSDGTERVPAVGDALRRPTLAETNREKVMEPETKSGADKPPMPRPSTESAFATGPIRPYLVRAGAKSFVAPAVANEEAPAPAAPKPPTPSNPPALTVPVHTTKAAARRHVRRRHRRHHAHRTHSRLLHARRAHRKHPGA